MQHHAPGIFQRLADPQLAAALLIPAQRKALAGLVEQIVPRRVRRVEYDLEIAWTPLGMAVRGTVAALEATVAA